MKITREEARQIINSYCDDIPRDDAVERAMNHDWTFDPRESRALEVAQQQDEADRVFYGDDLNEQTLVNSAVKG